MSEKDLEKSSKHIEEVSVADENQVPGETAVDYETALEAIRNYPWQVAWCVYALWVLTLSSYDNQAGGIFLSIPQFRKDFGYAFEGNYVLQSNWQSAFSGGPTASAIIGAFGSSYLADRIGRKIVYLIAFVVMLVGITLETVATTNPLFFVGKFINGFAVGGFGTITVAYIGEIAPHALRGAMTAGIGISFTLGPFLVTLLTNAYGTMTTRWAYRGIFVSQYAITFLGIIGLPFMPESPWWLITAGKTEKALRALRKLGCPESDLHSRLDYMRATLERSKSETEGVNFLECFKKSNLRRTLIAIAPISIQALAGVLFIIMYASYYIQLAGYSASTSFKISIASIVLAMLGNISSWFIVDRVGRRTLTLWGLFLLSGMLMACGGLGIDTSNTSNVKGVIGLMTAYSYVYNITIGATAYNFLAEVSTSRLRAKTASIGLAVQSALYTMFSFILPYIFNPDMANLGAKTSFIFGGLSIISLLAMWIWMPETSKRTYRELDEMFAKHVPARKFKDYDGAQNAQYKFQ